MLLAAAVRRRRSGACTRCCGRPASRSPLTALGLAFLTQSRGVLLGFCCGAAVALALGPDRLRRAWLAILAVAAVAIASGRLLAPYDAFVAAGAAPSRPRSRRRSARWRCSPARASRSRVLRRAVRRRAADVRTRHARALRAVAARRARRAHARRRRRAASRSPANPVALRRATRRASSASSTWPPRRDAARLHRRPALRPVADRAGASSRSAPVIGVGEGGYPVRLLPRARDRPQPLHAAQPAAARARPRLGLVGALLLAGRARSRRRSRSCAAGRGRRPQERRWASALAAARRRRARPGGGRLAVADPGPDGARAAVPRARPSRSSRCRRRRAGRRARARRAWSAARAPSPCSRPRSSSLAVRLGRLRRAPRAAPTTLGAAAWPPPARRSG